MRAKIRRASGALYVRKARPLRLQLSPATHHYGLAKLLPYLLIAA
jgi:hypothetical protein